jgi:hypothetical protein
MLSIRMLAMGALAALAAACLTITPATADPQQGLAVQTVCNDGTAYTTIARAAQEWNGQLVTDNTSVFHLTWYEITFEITAPDGTLRVVGPFTVDKGGNDRSHKDLLDCTFSFDLVLPDGSRSHVSGPAKGWVTPSRP